MQARERIIINDEGADLLREVVTREPAPLLALAPWFAPVGAGRGEWEDAQAIEAEYIRPARAA